MMNVKQIEETKKLITLLEGEEAEVFKRYREALKADLEADRTALFLQLSHMGMTDLAERLF